MMVVVTKRAFCNREKMKNVEVEKPNKVDLTSGRREKRKKKMKVIEKEKKRGNTSPMCIAVCAGKREGGLYAASIIKKKRHFTRTSA